MDVNARAAPADLQADVQGPPRAGPRLQVRRFAFHPRLQLPEQLRQRPVVLLAPGGGARGGVLRDLDSHTQKIFSIAMYIRT